MFRNPRLLELAKQSRFWLVLTITSGFLSGLLTIGQAQSVSRVVSRVFLEQNSLPEVRPLLHLTLLFFTLRAFLRWFRSLSAKSLAIQVKTRVRMMLLKHLEDLGPAFLQQERSGEISSTVVDGVESLDAYFSQYLPQLVLSALIPVSILFFVFPMDLLSGVILLITAPLIPFFMYLIGRTSRNLTDRQYHTLSRLSAQFLDSLQGLTTLKLFNQAQARTQRIQESSDQYQKTTMKVLQVTFLSALALELLATLSTAVIAVQIGLRLLYFRISFEQAFFLLLIAPEFYIPLRMLGLRYHAGMAGQSAAARIFSILDTKPLRGDGTGTVRKSKFPTLRELTIEQVSFTYPGDPAPTLQRVSLSIQAGEKIALVGESGAGKSTLVSLILGFVPPQAGQIRVNGRLLQPEEFPAWRELIAWVPQQPALFQGTIADNIRLARPGAEDAAVIAAARNAHLDTFIQSLPGGYQTEIGEGGLHLSGGQAQRLALARAFLKNAPLLIMDEPTSQLDPVIETRLADATRQLMEGRTVITIAHRLNTIFQADRILVLQQGRILERGTHQTLLSAGGAYSQLVQAYTGGAPQPDGSDPPDLFEGTARTTLPNPQPQEAPGTGLNHPPNHREVFRKLLGFLSRHWKQVSISVLLGFLTVISSVGLMGTSAWLISAAALHPSIAKLEVAIVGVRFFGILRGISRYLERLSSHQVTFQVLKDLRVWFYRSLAPLAPARLQTYRSGDLLSRIVSDIKTLEDFYIRSLAPPLVAILVGIASVVFLGGYLSAAGYLLGFFFLLLGLVVPLIVRRLSLQPGRTLVHQRSRLHETLINFVQGLPDLLVFGRTEDRKQQMEVVNQHYNRAQLSLARISGLNEGAGILLSNLAMWLVLIAAIPGIRTGELPGVMLAVLALVTLSLFESVQPLPEAVENLSSSLESGSRLMEVIHAEPAVKDPPQPARFPDQLSLHARQVSFTYPGNSSPALQEVSFHLQEKEFLAVVGPSGSGKSTLASLLLRFWDGYQGSLAIGAEKIILNKLPQEEVRGRVSVVSQNSYLFHETIRENIALGKPDATDQEITAAAQKAKLHQFIRSLPAGYETYVGERGQRLSGGERQRIAIARAVLKDAPIFLLDEPTANLDPLTEQEVLSTLFDVLRGKTSLLITHRLVGLSEVDRILVFHQGRILEQGTEAELLAKKGFYYQMWSLQNRILHYS